MDDLSLHAYSNLHAWVAQLDETVEQKLAGRLEAGIRAWTGVLIQLHFTLKQLAEMHVTKFGVDTKGGDHGDEAKRKARCHSKGSSKRYFSTTTYHGCAVSAAGAWLKEDDPGAGAQCRAPLREREFRFRPSCHGAGVG